ncbi:MAG: hypothetical protein JWN23_2535 [Rhodocyclales bacterium]|nr:hypothetical protein [Rhodocyclales bacterium]
MVENRVEASELGQFIPLHYHHIMLMDQSRVLGFKAAIDSVVFEGAKVLDLGGGTGVLSFFAAARASKVWCVEFNPDMVAESRRLLALNGVTHKVEVVHADAFQYLPPEPVDVVICEMIHAAMLREKQVEVIEAFKQRYRSRFGDRLPVFMPEAVLMAVQPVQQSFDCFGFYAPIIQFQHPEVLHPDTLELAEPAIYSLLDFSQQTSREIQWRGAFAMAHAGSVNALRFVTKNVLSIIADKGTTIDWINHYLVMPLSEPVEVGGGDRLLVEFSYLAGGSLQSLAANMRVAVEKATG